MKAKTAIGIAVASALSWSYGAWANGEYMDPHSSSSFGAITPYSPNESGPAAWPGERDMAIDTHDSGMAAREIETPLASNEAGMSDPFAAREPVRRDDLAQRSLPNPQTPWSPNEAGFDRHADGMQTYEQQRAAIEQARVAAAEWNAHLGSGENAVLGSTAGSSLHGSVGYESSAQGVVSAVPESGNEAGMRSDSARTAAMRPESEYGAPSASEATVGVLEVPASASEYTVWNVEPLTPQADLTRGDTVYLAPESSEPVVILGSSPEAPSDAARSAAIAGDDSSAETSVPSL